MGDEQGHLEQAIDHLEAQRIILGDNIVNSAIEALQEKLVATRTAANPHRKQVTIFFADISRFTSIAELMDAEELSDIINELWARLDQVIIEAGGTIDKHIGDAVMAVFGAPTTNEDDPMQAVHCALRMQSALAEFQVQRPTAIQDHPFAKLGIRIGISTGPVVMTSVGSKHEYTAMGATVNLAERLQQAAPSGGILICQDTYLQVRGLFQVERAQHLKLKGKPGWVAAYLVRAEKPILLRTSNRGMRGLKTSMIGRDRELLLLQSTFQNVTAGRGSDLITVIAEAGMGKSRLRREFESWLDRTGTPTWIFSAMTFRQMIGLPYSLVRELFASYFSIRDSDASEVAYTKLEQGFTALIGERGVEGARSIGSSIGITSATSAPAATEINAREIRDNAFRAAASFFITLAATQPVVLILDDLQWADEGSLDFIEYLSAALDTNAVLIACFARPILFERCPGFGTASDGQRLALSPLTSADSRALVSDILRRVADLPLTLLNFIVERAEGNPFYIEELIKNIIEDGVIVRAENGWQVIVENLDEERIPATLTGVLQARLDSLPPLERAVMERASVIGKVFWDGAVARLSATSSRSVIHTALKNLESKELIYRHDHSDFTGNEEYSFKHIILRDVTYEGVLRKMRRAYHAQVVQWLIEQSGERAAEYAGLIGEHYEQAEQRIMATHWYIKAAEQAQNSYVDEIAISYYQRAQWLLPETQEHQAAHIAVYEGLGTIYKNQARFHEAVDAYFSMIQAAMLLQDEEKQVGAWLGMAFAQDELGDHHASLKSVTKAEEIARRTGSEAVLARALHGKGWVLQLLGSMDAAEELGREALSLCEGMANHSLMVSCCNLLATICTARGDYERAIYWFEQCLTIVRGLGAMSRLPITLSNLGEAKLSLGQAINASELFSEALTVARDIGSRRAELTALINQGRAQLALTKYDVAEANLRAAIDLAGTEPPPFLVIAYAALSESLLAQGGSAQALEVALAGFALGQGTKGWEFIAPAWMTLGMVASHMGAPLTLDGRSVAAAELFAEAVSIYQRVGMKSEARLALGRWAEHEQASGNHEYATQLRHEAAELAFRP